MKNNEKELDVIELVKVVWSKRKKIFLFSGIALVVGLVVAFSLPRSYTSSIQIVTESNTKTNSSAGALASMMGVSVGGGQEGISEEIYPQIVSSSPFLMEFAPMKVPYKGQFITLENYLLKYQKSAWWNFGFLSDGASNAKEQSEVSSLTSPVVRQKFLRAMSLSIGLEKDKKTNIILISATFQDPVVAQMVADTMLTNLQEYITRYKTQKIRATLETNTRMMEEAREKYDKANMAYAVAVDRNQNLISKAAQVRVDRLNDESRLAFTIYQQLAQQVETDKIKLGEETPIATVIEPSQVPIVPSAPNRKLIVILITLLVGLGTVVGIVTNQIITKDAQ